MKNSQLIGLKKAQNGRAKKKRRYPYTKDNTLKFFFKARFDKIPHVNSTCDYSIIFDIHSRLLKSIINESWSKQEDKKWTMDSDFVSFLAQASTPFFPFLAFVCKKLALFI